MHHGAREIEGFGVAIGGGFFDFGSAGVGEAEHFPNFVEGFASGIVPGGAELGVFAGPADFH